jgi:hypothetical protein
VKEERLEWYHFIIVVHPPRLIELGMAELEEEGNKGRRYWS